MKRLQNSEVIKNYFNDRLSNKEILHEEIQNPIEIDHIQPELSHKLILLDKFEVTF